MSHLTLNTAFLMSEANCRPIEEGNDYTDWRHHHTDWSTGTVHCEHWYETFTTAYSDETDLCHTSQNYTNMEHFLNMSKHKDDILSIPDECIQCARVNVTITLDEFKQDTKSQEGLSSPNCTLDIKIEESLMTRISHVKYISP